MTTTLALFFFSKGILFYDPPNSQLLIQETVLYLHSNNCGRFWGEIGELGQNRPEKKTYH
jgi:hypothetical protein